MSQTAKALREIEWTKFICGYLVKQTTIRIIPLVASARSGCGICDRLFVHDKWVGLVEFKGVTTRVTASQILFMKQCNVVRPYSCFVWRQVASSKYMVRLEYHAYAGAAISRCVHPPMIWDDCGCMDTFARVIVMSGNKVMLYVLFCLG